MTSTSQRILSAVIFTDIQGYSAITHEDEQKALGMVSRFKETVDACTKEYRGEIINYLGDGSLSIHSSAIDAVRCAIAMQQSFRKGPVIPVRIGIHMGDIVKRDNSIFGDAVNIAARIQDICPPGSVLYSDRVQAELRNHRDLKTVFIGQERVKNISDPLMLYGIKHKDLHLPSLREVHRANVTRRPGRRIYQLVALLFLLAFIGSIIVNRSRSSSDLNDERLMVLPFVNETGDSTLNYIGSYTSRSISRVIEQTGEAKIVPYDSLRFLVGAQQLGMLPASRLARGMGAANVITGTYSIDPQENIRLRCTLYIGTTMEPIIGFPETAAPLRSFHEAIREIATRIAGYWTTKDIGYISIPTVESNRAFEIAMDYWTRDYSKAIEYLDRAIQIDSTFLDAYYWRIDGYYNLDSISRALEGLELIEDNFDIVEFSDDQMQTFRYYERHLSGDRVGAFEILMSYYDRDPTNIIQNTTTASLALLWMNEPTIALRILDQLPPDSIDFRENEYFQRRLRIGMRALNLTGQYQRALDLAEQYPRPIKDPLYPRMLARSYAGLKDTTALNQLIRTAQLGDAYVSPKKLALIAADWFTRSGDSLLACVYYDRYMDISEDIDLDYLYAMYYCGESDEALDMLTEFTSDLDLSKFPMDGLHCLVSGYTVNGDTSNAKRIIEIARQSNVESQRKNYSLAKLYAAIGDIEMAAVLIERSVFGGYLFLSGRYDEDVHLTSIMRSRAYDKASHPLQ